MRDIGGKDLGAGKYRIAVVAACPFPYPRGTPIRILRMSEGLAASGHEVHVVTYHLGQRFLDLPVFVHRISNIFTYRKTSPGPTYQKIFFVDVLLTLKLYQVVKSQDIDIIHAHHYEGLIAGLAVSRLTGIPVVFDVHTLLSSELPQYQLGLPRWFVKKIGAVLDRMLPLQAEHIIAVTDKIRSRLIEDEAVPPQKITTVYSAVENELLSVPSPGTVADVERTLVFAGNLAPYQGIDVMLRAFRLILDRRPDTILRIVSEDQIYPYKNLISTLKLQENIVFEKFEYFQLPARLHTALIALNPRPQADGMPVKLLNYMATGRAIVSFSGSGEILEHENTALLVSHPDEQHFAQAVLRLLDDPPLARKLGHAAQAMAQEFFLQEAMVKTIEQVYDKVKRKPL